MTNYTLDPNQAPYLLGDPFSEPPARAREHWPALAKRMEKLDRAREQQARYGAEIIRLRDELALAKQRDQQALGEALAADKPDPWRFPARKSQCVATKWFPLNHAGRTCCRSRQTL
jgi:hypothetical protein